MKKFLKWSGIGCGGLIALLVLASAALYPVGAKTLTRTYPGIQVESLPIPADEAAVAHGRHVAVIWECTKCHGDDLAGTLLADDPFLGTIPAPNLTSGRGGIGPSYTDTDWVRAIRHGVKPDGRGEAFMYDYSTLSDNDLGVLIAYLKQAPPVDSDHPAARMGPIVPLAPAIGLFTPSAQVIDHDASRPAEPVPGATVEYGRYLFAICAQCHSTSLADKLVKWRQEDFVRAVRTGVLPNGRQLPAAMSPKNLGELSDMELAALWNYLTGARP